MHIQVAAGDAVTAVEQYTCQQYLGTGMTFFTANGETIDLHGGGVNKQDLIRLEADQGETRQRPVSIESFVWVFVRVGGSLSVRGLEGTIDP